MIPGFSEDVVISAETNIELFEVINKFIEQVEKHIEKYPAYGYDIIFLGGDKGDYSAKITIKKDGKKESEDIKGDSPSHGVL